MCSHIFLNIITAPSWYSRWTSSGRDCVNVDKALLYSKTVWRRDAVGVNTLKLYCNSSCRRAGGRDIITKSIAPANNEALIKEYKRTKRLCQANVQLRLFIYIFEYMWIYTCSSVAFNKNKLKKWLLILTCARCVTFEDTVWSNNKEVVNTFKL